MKVRLLTSRAGVNFADNVGDVIDVDAGEAQRMIESGQAEPVAETRTKRAEKRPSTRKAEKRG